MSEGEYINTENLVEESATDHTTAASALVDLTGKLKKIRPEGYVSVISNESVPETNGYFATTHKDVGVAVFPNPDGTMEFIIVSLMPSDKISTTDFGVE